MVRIFFLVLFLGITSLASAQVAESHEPTSATDGDVKLHNTKRSRFLRTSHARKTERQGKGKDVKFRADARETERHGKSMRRNRGSKKLNGEARVFNKHTTTSANSATKKSKIRRSLGRSVE